MILNVPLRRLFVMVNRIQVVSVRKMRVLSRLGMISLIVMLCGEFVMLRGLLVVLGRFLMMLRNAV
jgi:hypothetical protein